MVEPEVRQEDLMADEEPKFLRRQKPVEIRRRKFGRQAWKSYARVAGLTVVGIGAGWLAFVTGRFLLFSPHVVLADLEEIQVRRNRYVPRAAVLEKFTADKGQSVLRVPLEERRAALEQILWVERASVRRVFPNGIRVDLMERTPVAFLRVGTELSLIDAHGVILERPLEGEFSFPVVTGLSEVMPLDDRRKRMQRYVQFLQDVELARPRAGETVSEVDLSEAGDLRATLAGLPELGDAKAGGQGAVLVHFGDADFATKFRAVVENIGQWRASVGQVYSVDLRFDRQVVVNPESPASPAGSPASAQNLGAPGKAQRR